MLRKPESKAYYVADDNGKRNDARQELIDEMKKRSSDSLSTSISDLLLEMYETPAHGSVESHGITHDDSKTQLPKSKKSSKLDNGTRGNKILGVVKSN
jgi:hypothetical protein